MQTLNRLLQLTDAAAVLTDLTRQKHTYTLPVMKTAETFYLHAENAAVRVVRWNKAQVEITVETRPPLAWRTATDYDEAGVYAVVLRRLGMWTLTRSVVTALVPPQMPLVLRLRDGLVSLDHVQGTLHIPPPDALPLELRPGT
jgi:hypothetical protein